MQVHFHLVWWSESLEIDKHSCTSQLRMRLLGSFEIKIAHSSKAKPSWQLVRICKYTSAPSLVTMGPHLGKGLLQQTWLGALSCLDNRTRMIWYPRVDSVSYPIYHASKIFCYLLPPFYVVYEVCEKKNKRGNFRISITAMPSRYSLSSVLFLWSS